jgi:hypothetical protein
MDIQQQLQRLTFYYENSNFQKQTPCSRTIKCAICIPFTSLQLKFIIELNVPRYV